MKSANQVKHTAPVNISPTMVLNRLGFDHATPVSDSGFGLIQSTHSGRKYFVSEEFRRGDHACVLLFAPSREDVIHRANELSHKAAAIAKAQERDFARGLARAPQFDTQGKVLLPLSAAAKRVDITIVD